MEGEGADDAPEALLCPDCGHEVDCHLVLGCFTPGGCRCPRAASDIARALTAEAVNIERTRLTAQLRQVISSVQDSGDLAELDALADAWEAGTDG